MSFGAQSRATGHSDTGMIQWVKGRSTRKAPCPNRSRSCSSVGWPAASRNWPMWRTRWGSASELSKGVLPRLAPHSGTCWKPRGRNWVVTCWPVVSMALRKSLICSVIRTPAHSIAPSANGKASPQANGARTMSVVEMGHLSHEGYSISSVRIIPSLALIQDKRCLDRTPRLIGPVRQRWTVRKSR